MAPKKKGAVEVPKADENQKEGGNETVQLTAAQFKEITEKLKMLEAIADKGRQYNYEASQKSDKKPIKVKLSVFNNGLIVGWRTVKDSLVKHPTTGTIVGETQEIEVQILDHENKLSTHTFNSYPEFSSARYDERVEAEIINKSEGYDGSISYDVKLEDGRIIKMDSRFVN